MKYAKWACILSILMTGCAVIPFAAMNKQGFQMTLDQQAEMEKTTPVCKTENQCKAAWSAARDWLLAHSERKLQVVTDDYLETYNAGINNGYDVVTGSVRKSFQSDGSTKILVSVSCQVSVFGNCRNRTEAQLVGDFNNKISAAMKS